MKLELWGGVECTVNRVGDQFFDQVERTGHASRIDDLERLVDLGIRAIRYPVLWERSTRNGSGSLDFSWSDERLGRLRELGIRVIAGLVHHGSGPQGTSLLEESFVTGLADFAGQVANRYPWIEDFTPVNEPLTTARFSALYGHWYPHRKDAASFLRALLIEVRATAAAMNAIRKVTPHARLIQTEDIGSIFATPRIAYQAEFENQRRWLSLDLLFGRVNEDHPLFHYLLENGVTDHELHALTECPCPPDLIGVNYYVTSDRFLDENISRYPTSCHGSNGRHRYADVEAVRVHARGIVGHQKTLEQTWNRYRTPMAITEAHLGCKPEQQIRWLKAAWQGAESAQNSGVDVRAVTLWSAFGSYDWDSLVTAPNGHYEPGAFDVRAPRPHPTAVAAAAKMLAREGSFEHALLNDDGWWNAPERLLYDTPLQQKVARARVPRVMPPVLIAGGSGMLGRTFAKTLAERGISARVFSHDELDICDADAVRVCLEKERPWLVINAAGKSAADSDSRTLREVLVVGATQLARECNRVGAKFLGFSSIGVFDGTKISSYVESSTRTPSSILGEQHAAMETRILAGFSDRALIVRSGQFFGHWGHTGPFGRLLHALLRGEPVAIPSTTWATPTYAPEFAHACLDLVMAGTSGVVHLAHCSPPVPLRDILERFIRVHRLTAVALLNDERSRGWLSRDFPARVSLASERIPSLSPLETALAEYARFYEKQAEGAAA